MSQYYVINLPHSEDRKERITRRLEYHNILNKTTFISAIDGKEKSELMAWFEQGSTHKKSTRPEHACFLSHLKALRSFLSSDQQEAIILEDDAVLCNNFTSRLNNVLQVKQKLEVQPKLILLCYLISSWEGVKCLTGSNNNTQLEDPEEERLCNITRSTYGGVAYWITRDYAQRCLNSLDKPLRLIPEDFVTSELITRMSGGCFATPPLVIEESVYSTLRKGNDLNVHRKFFSGFGLNNYSQGDGMSVQNLW